MLCTSASSFQFLVPLTGPDGSVNAITIDSFLHRPVEFMSNGHITQIYLKRYHVFMMAIMNN